jgi:sugar phosphate isomerase/epimerase
MLNRVSYYVTILQMEISHKPANLTSRIYVHVPFAMLLERLKYIERMGLQPEIYINADVLDSPPVSQLKQVERVLRLNKLGCTVHAPFMDLSPGAVDKRIRRLSLERIVGLVRMVAELAPQVIVVHPGYDDLHYGDSQDLWFQNSLETWHTVLEEAQKHKLRLALENIFDKTPLLLAKLIKTLNSQFFGHCFDIGHFNLFADYPLADWFDFLGPHLFELHLHDNNGIKDEHLGLGEGSIDLRMIFGELKIRNLEPILVIEAHTEKQALLSLERIGDYLD